MKGGGLTWVGWLMVGVGGMLIYAGMTGQSLVSELGAVLRGDSLDAYRSGGSVHDSQVPAAPTEQTTAPAPPPATPKPDAARVPPRGVPGQWV